MAVSMHEASVPVFTRAPGRHRVIPEKGEAGADHPQIAAGQLLQRALELGKRDFFDTLPQRIH